MGDAKIDYTAKDYESLLTFADNALTNYLPEFTSKNDSDINWVTIKILCFLQAIEMFYIDFAVSEMNSETVQIYENLLRICRRKGYRPKKQSGALAQLSVTLKGTVALPYTMPKGTVFKTAAGVKYSLTADVVFDVVTKTVDVRYGEYENIASFAVGNGEAYQEYILQRAAVLEGTVEVTIDDAGNISKWTEVPTLLMYGSTDKVYRLALNADETYSIMFGDNFNGKIVPVGAIISVELWNAPANVVAERYGNIGAAAITTSDDTNVATVTQAAAANGGAAAESFAAIVRNVQQYSAVQEVASSLESYEYLATRVPGVARAKAFASDIYTIALFIIPVGGGIASVPLRNAVDLFFRKRVFGGTSVNVLVPQEVPVDITVDIAVADNQYQANVKQAVIDALEAYLEDSEYAGESMLVSETYEIIQEVAGLTSFLVTKHALAAGSGVSNVSIAYNQMRAIGTITVNASGGIV